MLVAYSLLSFTYNHRLTLVTRWMSPGFLFGCKDRMIFSKVPQKSDENHVKQNANVCIVVQVVWEHKIREYGISG